MHPLTISLEGTTIHASKISRLLQAPMEFVVDYEFTGNNILAATYSGSSGRHAKLNLLNSEGDLVATCKLPAEPLYLFTSCLGLHYCVCSDKFYPLIISDSSISLRKPYDIKFLPGLMQCEQSFNGNQYFRLADRQNFRVQYGMVTKGDSTFKPFITFEEKEVASASNDEWMVIQALLEHLNFKEAARRQLLRLKWDRGSYAHINMPLFAKNDTLIIFDFFKKDLLLYDLTGTLLTRVPVQFKWKETQQFHIIRDEASGKLYIHRYDNNASQTIEVLNIHTGTATEKIAIAKPFAEQVKIYKGDIYMLWQDERAHATRQLFIQRHAQNITETAP